MIASAPAFAVDELPDLGDSSARALSPEREREYSQGLLRQMRNYDITVEDAEVTEYYETLAYRLLAASGRTEGEFHFALVNVPVINAFASPGGLIVMFSGLMLAAENESEMAGVLAHEIAHVTQKHIARAMETTAEEALPILLASLALAMATQGQGDGAQAAMIGGMGLLQQRQINFTRENEFEADRVGIQTLAKAGFDPIGMADFFARLGQVYRVQGEQPPQYLQTHPVTTIRIAEAKARADGLRVGTTRTSLEFALMRERLRVLSSRDLPGLVRYYKDTRRDAQLNPTALRYGLALAHIRLGDAKAAKIQLDSIADALKGRLTLELALAEYERAAGLDDAAQQRYQRLLAERPGHRVVVTAFAQAQIERDDAEGGRKAVAALRDVVPRFPNDPVMHELMARASLLSGDEVRAAEAYAQAFFLRGKFEDAMKQLERTAERGDLDYYQRARIDAQVAQWRPVVLRERGAALEQARRQ